MDHIGTSGSISYSQRYLDIIFDQKFKFRSYIEQIVAKGTKYAFVIA